MRWTDKYGDLHVDYIASVKNQSEAEKWAKGQDADASNISSQKEGIVENGYTDADATRRRYKLNEDGTITALAYGKPTTTEHDVANAEPASEKKGEPTSPADAVSSLTSMTAGIIDEGLGAAQRTGEMMAVPSKAGNGTVDIVEKAIDYGKEGAVLGKVVKTAGIVGSLYDMGSSIQDAVGTFNDPNATTSAKVGATAKALFKTAMVFVRVNPIINVALTVADVTGVTDSLFKW